MPFFEMVLVGYCLLLTAATGFLFRKNMSFVRKRQKRVLTEADIIRMRKDRHGISPR